MSTYEPDEALEARVAEAIRDAYERSPGYYMSKSTSESLAYAALRAVGPTLLARGREGLSVEWGTEYEEDRDTSTVYLQPTEDAARFIVSQSPTDTGLRRRYVSDWEEAS